MRVLKAEVHLATQKKDAVPPLQRRLTMDLARIRAEVGGGGAPADPPEAPDGA